MSTHISVPIFASPTRPIGTAQGRIVLSRVPAVGQGLPWEDLIPGREFEDLLATLNTTRVEYVDASPQIASVECVVGLDGVYANSDLAARKVASDLASLLRLVYSDYF